MGVKSRKILNFLRITQPTKKTGLYRLNMYNPITWLFLILCSLLVGIEAFFSTIWEFLAESYISQKEANKYKI